jgi:hypothetical protein
MRPHLAILRGREVVPVNDLLAWAKWFENASANGADGRRVGGDFIGFGVRVSTVFLGINHQHSDGPPLWFESMVFADDSGHDLNEFMARYSTWEQAEAGHAYLVAVVKGEVKAAAQEVRDRLYAIRLGMIASTGR